MEKRAEADGGLAETRGKRRAQERSRSKKQISNHKKILRAGRPTSKNSKKNNIRGTVVCTKEKLFVGKAERKI